MVTTPESTRTRWGAVLALGLAMLMVSIEVTLAAVTLPLIGAELGASPGQTSWVVLGYALPSAALVIPAGRWVDRADLRQVFLLAVAAVGVTSVLAAAAPTFGVLVAARVLQGICGAMVVAVYLPVVTRTVPAGRRGSALGLITMIMPLGAAAGASLGGLAADAYGWRVVFLAKLPILLVALVLGHRAIPGSGNSTSTGTGGSSSSGSDNSGDDDNGSSGLPVPRLPALAEVLLLGGAVTAFLLGLEWMSASPVLAGAALLAAAVLAAGWARVPQSRPLLAILRRPPVSLPLAGLLLAGTALGVTAFLLPYFVAEVLQRGPSLLGVALLFSIGATAVASPLAGFASDRCGPVVVSVLGGMLTALGLWSMLSLGPDARLGALAWRLALVGAGQGLFHAPVTAAILAAVPAAMAGAAGGLGMTARTIAFTVGPALAALGWSAGGGGAGGFRTALLVLLSLQVAGVVVMAAAAPIRRSRRAG